MARESAWLLDMCDRYDAAVKAGHHEDARDCLISVVNRCAQLSMWADLYTPQGVELPGDRDPFWETLAETQAVTR